MKSSPRKHPRPIRITPDEVKTVTAAVRAEASTRRDAELLLAKVKVSMLEAQQARVEIFERLAKKYDFNATHTFSLDERTGVLTPQEPA